MSTGYNRADTVNNIADGNIINASDLDAEYDAIAAAFAEVNGHTHDGSDGEGAPITKVGPAQDIVVSTGGAIPKANNTVDLGSATYQYKDIYIDGTAYIDALDLNGTLVTSSAAELNILDGVTASAAELNVLDGITASTAELNLLDGVTSSTAELNLLDGVIASTAEINFIDGVTSNIQTQLNARQPLDAQLTDIAGLTPTDNAIIIGNGTNFVTETGATARASLGLAIGTDVQAYDADLTTLGAGGASARAFLGLTIGTDVQAYDPELAALSGLTPTDNAIIVGNGTTFVTESGATARTSLGLGSIATQDASNVTISGGSIAGITDLAIADGGTGASTATAAINNLLPSQASASGKYLKSDGTNTSWDDLNISTADITGTLAIANGGTGATSAGAARTALGLVIGTDVLSPSGSGAALTSLDATNLSSGTVAAARLPAFTGDATSTAGTSALTLATVNANTGAFGSTTSIPVITVNAKGLITAVSTATVSGSISVTGGDLTLSGNTGTAITNATLATVNSNTGSFGSASSIPVVTVNAKGLVTAVSTATVQGGQYFGSAASKAIAFNEDSIAENITTTSGKNCLSVGPITIASGFTVTIASGQRWVVL